MSTKYNLEFLFGPEILPPAPRPVKQVLYRANPYSTNNQINSFVGYRKIPKISPSKYKPPKPVTQKNLR